MTKEEVKKHNETVINNVIMSLIDLKLVDPIRMMYDHKYASDMVINYIEAANLTREMLNMPKLVLYDITES